MFLSLIKSGATLGVGYDEWSDAECLRRGLPKNRHKRPPTERELFMRSKEWKEARKACLASMGAVCSECGSTERIQVDHIKPRSKFPELALEPSNLRPLCWPCNGRKGFKVLSADA